MNKFFIAAVVGIFFGFVAYNIASITSKENIFPVNNKQYFSEVYSAINNAEKSVHISMFTIKYYSEYEESNEKKLLDALINAARRGLDVKVMTEGGSSFLGDAFVLEQRPACDYLSSGGVDARFDAPDRTTHTKLVIIDSSVIILGSTNWNYYALEENNEANIVVESREVAEKYENYFESLWSESVGCSFNTTAGCDSVNAILSNRNYCSGKTAFANGTAENVIFKASKKGNNYTTFSIGEISVFSWGHPNVTDGQLVFVKGIYSKEKTIGDYVFTDEIEAENVEILP
ncbi:MAG: hypothetical protein HZB66_01850 [Candidatus Aenigmarchaeota archaeon]|nr:hypothetical protein [Candidatus Aenigmarchaeota archaeon]